MNCTDLPLLGNAALLEFAFGSKAKPFLAAEKGPENLINRQG